MKIERNRSVKSWYDIVQHGRKVGYGVIVDQRQGPRCLSWSKLRYVGDAQVEEIHLASVLLRKGRRWSLKRYEWCEAGLDYAWCEVFDGRMVLERRGTRTTQQIPPDCLILPLVRMIAQYPRWGAVRDQVTFTLLETGNDQVIGPASLVRISAAADRSGPDTYNLLAGDELLETLVVEKGRLMKTSSDTGVSMILTSPEGALSRLPLPIQALEIRDQERKA